MESLFWGRTDYQDFNARYKTSGLEWIWQGSESMGESAQIFAGALFGTGGGGYSTWINFDSTDDQVQDNPERHDYNVDQWVDFVVQSALDQANHTKTDHQLWACGTDFQYQNSDHWFTNLDKLIHYLKQNGTINAFYSTPSLYVDAKKKDTSVTWEVCYVRVLVFENFNDFTSMTRHSNYKNITHSYHNNITRKPTTLEHRYDRTISFLLLTMRITTGVDTLLRDLL